MRLVALLVFLFVSADMVNPLTPGAFAFDPDDSIDLSRSGEHHWDEPGAAREADASPHPGEPARAVPCVVRTPSPGPPAPACRAAQTARTTVAATADASGRSPDSDH